MSDNNKWSATNSHVCNGDIFEQRCHKCGTLNKVEVSTQDAHNESEEYYCASCHRQLGTKRASLTPKTTEIKEDLPEIVQKLIDSANKYNNFVTEAEKGAYTKEELSAFHEFNIENANALCAKYIALMG